MNKHCFKTFLFFILFMMMPVLGMQKIAHAIVISAEPVLAQKMPSPSIALQDIDKWVIRHALNNNQQTLIDIEKHRFLIPDLHIGGKFPSFRGSRKNPFVINVSGKLDDNSDLSRYIAGVCTNNQEEQLQSHYTKFERNGLNYTLKSSYHKRGPLFDYIQQIKNNRIFN